MRSKHRVLARKLLIAQVFQEFIARYPDWKELPEKERDALMLLVIEGTYDGLSDDEIAARIRAEGFAGNTGMNSIIIKSIIDSGSGSYHLIVSNNNRTFRSHPRRKLRPDPRRGPGSGSRGRFPVRGVAANAKRPCTKPKRLSVISG